MSTTRSCPTCNGDCFVPAVTERERLHPDATDGADPNPTRCPKCAAPTGYDANGNLVHKHKIAPWSRCDGLAGR